VGVEVHSADWEDFQVTERLTRAGEILGITVLDHIVHGDGTGEVVSVREYQ
jgi:DNA repair protein RadC